MESHCSYQLSIRIKTQDGRFVDRIALIIKKQIREKTTLMFENCMPQKNVPELERNKRSSRTADNLGKLTVEEFGKLQTWKEEIDPDIKHLSEKFRRVDVTSGMSHTKDYHVSSSSGDYCDHKKETHIVNGQLWDNSPKCKDKLTFKVAMDPILASCLSCELVRSQAYRDTFMTDLMTFNGCLEVSGHGITAIHLSILLTESHLFSIEPDIRWCKRMLPMWLLRLSMDDAFSWLSTLGGAYSALGDESLYFAEKAGQVSVHQMSLALHMGDPILQARCMVYLAQSLMQKGFFKAAVYIVRKQYQFAVSLGENTDQRLINMCKGVWSIMQHMHERRRLHRKNNMGLHNGCHTASTISR